MPEQCCHWCGRPLSVCRTPVDERWPARAREAFERAGYTDAATCPEGQRRDMAGTGWCFDRARRDRYWTGEDLTLAEQTGVGFRREAMDRGVRI